jgi:16S rRNA (uracil1498-N3)-methyltransferase
VPLAACPLVRIIRRVARRVHVSQVSIGEIALSDREAHHVRDVLRLEAGTRVEVFGDGGQVGDGILGRVGPTGVTIVVESIQAVAEHRRQLRVASAVPKAARADWLVEKLSELGADVFIPLATERSVALPEGRGKLDRWGRLAAEAAKQSHRRGVMRIEPLTPLPQAIAAATQAGPAWCLSTGAGATPIAHVIGGAGDVLTVFVGPEGGWSPPEVRLFEEAGIPSVMLTNTILRIETAAITAVALIAARGTPLGTGSSPSP